MRNFSIKITGTSPLIMNSGRLINPLEPATKELANAYGEFKRDKTDESFLALAQAEFIGSLYFIDGIGPVWPSDNLRSCLRNGGKKKKKVGSRASLANSVASAVLFTSTDNPLWYGKNGPRTIEELWADENHRLIKACGVQRAKVMRTRPVFREWEFEAEGVLDTEVIDLVDFQAVADIAGKLIGLGNWRPELGGNYGKFDAVITDLGEYKIGS